jgi:hypothetical protein
MNKEVPHDPDLGCDVAPGGWIDRLNIKIVMELMGFDPMTNLQGKRFGKGPTTNAPKC